MGQSCCTGDHTSAVIGITVEDHGTDSHTASSRKKGGKIVAKDQKQVMSPFSGRHLVLNVDVNKTVIMRDTVVGKSAKQVVNEALANVVWGESADGKWELKVPMPCSTKPKEHPQLISYCEFAENLYPGSKNKKNRMQLYAAFTDPDGPGERLSNLANKAVAQLVNADGSDVGIVPSFYEALLRLKCAGQPFTICFRTFGEDLGDLCEEFNSFCEGRHPGFPNIVMDGSDNGPDYRFSLLSTDRCGTFHRNEAATSLVLGTIEQPGEGKHKQVEDRSLAFFDRFPHVKIISGLAHVQAYFDSMYAASGTFALRDDYSYWKAHGQSEAGGKPFFYTVSNARHEVFFDDNVHFDNFHIVQPINMLEPERKPWIISMLQTHVVRAEPWDAISCRSYFTDCLERLARAYSEKLAARQRLRNILTDVATCVRVLRQFRGYIPSLARQGLAPVQFEEKRRNSASTGKPVAAIDSNRHDAWREQRSEYSQVRLSNTADRSEEVSRPSSLVIEGPCDERAISIKST